MKIKKSLRMIYLPQDEGKGIIECALIDDVDDPVKNTAVEIQQHERREMTLQDALVIIGQISRQIEALGI